MCLQFKNALIPLNFNNVQYIIIHHPAVESATIEQIHQWHLNNGWSGVGYNEYITKTGIVRIGRGDNVGAHCADNRRNYNTISYGICCEGNYNKEKTMSPAQFAALVKRIRVAQQKFKNATLVPHKQLTATSCPGKYFPWQKLITTLTLPILKFKSSGEPVRILQEQLKNLGYMVVFLDGRFGALTRRAVVKFQRDHGLVADGIVGPKTWGALSTLTSK